ncbi:phosphoribosylaminoimidazolesuccinocarboxamide synthase [Aggregatilinea lenta]|uniref:phosphoribosylaminoimidazolesuccinocarboxamide synthase n=1 Tax=Aggregatilinea lenta TaxID=913108 RepID=UPI000E5BDFA4|nr:phosphoribosylaminoimidazolesuccinocarboxamide synthase [Aggregatilinea lenta]
MLTPGQIRPVIPQALESIDLPGLAGERGQVRDNFVLQDGRRVVISTDRFTIFNQQVGLVPYKGQVLNQLTLWWFEQTANIMPNHLIDVVDPNTTIALTAHPLPIAVVVRAFLTGVTPASLWMRYEAGEREIYGMTFPDGMRKNQELPQPIVTATSKEFGRTHEQPLTDEEIVALGPEQSLWERIQDKALKLFMRGQQLCILSDLILVDSKYEFGLDLNGDLVLIDELHTPDSSRLWRSDTYDELFEEGQEPESFDKEFVRLWYQAQGYRDGDKLPPLPDDLIVTISRHYQDVYEMLTGTPFLPATYPSQRRIWAALHAANVLG